MDRQNSLHYKHNKVYGTKLYNVNLDRMYRHKDFDIYHKCMPMLLDNLRHINIQDGNVVIFQYNLVNMCILLDFDVLCKSNLDHRGLVGMDLLVQLDKLQRHVND